MQVLLSGILLAVPPDVLRTVPGVKQLVESILPYSERHFARLDRLHKASFLLDYTLRAMKIAVPTDAGLETSVALGTKIVFVLVLAPIIEHLPTQARDKHRKR